MELTFTIKYRKNTGVVISAAELMSTYLYGIIIQSRTGESLSQETINYYIDAAQKEVEDYFNLKFKRQMIDIERLNYYRQDYYQQFPIFSTEYPVVKPLSLFGMMGKIEQMKYPPDWLTSTASGDEHYQRRISLVPTGSSTAIANAGIILTGITSQVGMQRFSNIPDYWNVQYVTGFTSDKIPLDLVNIIGKMASIALMNIAGDMIFGSPGIAGMSLSIDGLSQSIQSTASATNAGYGARIIQYQKEIKETVGRIKLVYDSIKFTVI